MQPKEKQEVQSHSEKLIEHTTNHFYKKKNKFDRKISMETLSEVFKPVASENYEFEKREDKNIKWTYSHVQLINFPK